MAETLLSIPSSGIAGAVSAQNYTHYTYSYTATQAQTYITFEFRQDPSFWGLDDIDFAPSGGGSNLLTNGGFENGQTGWTLIGVQGLPAAGQVVSNSSPGSDYTQTHSGSGYWYDGAVGGIDGIYQAVSTTIGQTYTIDFWLSGAAASSSSPALAQVQVGSNVYSSTPGNLTLDPASDTGVQGDNYTTDTQPTIDGTGFAGDTVTLYDGSTVIGTGTIGNDGNFRVTPTAPLSGGVHHLSATQTDGQGQTSAYSGTFTITLPPDTPVLQLTAASDSGALGDGITNVNTPTITATGVVGDTIALFESGQAFGTATVGSDGTWSYTPSTPLGDGTYHFTATETDGFGNTSPTSSTFDVTVDTVAPAAPSFTLQPGSDSGQVGDGITNHSSVTFDGSAEAGSTVTIDRDGSPLASFPLGPYTAFSDNTSLGDGTHQFTVTATDAAGNVSLVTTYPITIDTSIPAVTAALADDSGSSPFDGITSDPTLVGGGDPGALVTFTENGNPVGTTTADGQGNWVFAPIGLPDGPHQLTATETDAAGNVGSAAVAFTLDTVAPSTPAIFGFAAGSDTGTQGDGLTDLAAPGLTGHAEAGSTVSVFDGSTPLGTTVAGPNGAWVFQTSPLSNGPHPITVTATDAAGHVSPASAPFTLTVDTVAPPFTAALANDTGYSSLDQLTHDPTVAGTGEAGDLVVVSELGHAIGTATVDGQGQWTYTPTTLSDGLHLLAVSEEDPAGNTTSFPLALNLDTTAPTAPTLVGLAPGSDSGAAGDGITNDPFPTLIGAAEAGSTLSFYEGSSLLGTTVVPPSGPWSFSPGLLADGVHQITATAIDQAGNVSASSQPFSLTIDTAAPALTVALLNDTGPSATDRITSDPTLAGAGDPNAVVTITEGTTTLGTTTADAQGNWIFVPTGLADGPHLLSAAETDAADNTRSVQLAMTLDTVAPASVSGLGLTIPSDTGLLGDGVTGVANPVLAGTAEPGSTVTLYDGSTALGTASVAPDGSWVFPSGTLADGVHQITAVVNDGAGNLSPSSQAFALTVDTTAPAVTAGLLHDTGVSNTDRITYDPTISGSGDANALVTIAEGDVTLGTVTADAQGHWTFAPQGMRDGVHTLVASETDGAGNSRSTPLTFSLDTAPPPDAMPMSPTVIGVARYFDTQSGTQFFTSSLSEFNGIAAGRPDLHMEGVEFYALNPTVAGGDASAAPVYRFFDTTYGTHFFTADAQERDSVIATRPDLQFEGVGFWEHTSAQPGDSAVYRFFDSNNGTHFYTADANERASVIATRPDMHYEGIGFYAPTPI